MVVGLDKRVMRLFDWIDEWNSYVLMDGTFDLVECHEIGQDFHRNRNGFGHITSSLR